MHSIRVKMMTVTIAAILTSILALGGIGVLTMGMESDRSSAEKMRLISENMQLNLIGYLDSIEQSVQMAIHIAHDSLDELDIEYLGRSADPERVEALDSAMAEHCAEVEHAFGSIASNTNGVVTYYYCVSGEYGSNEHGFFWSRKDADDFERQTPLDSADLDRADTDHTSWYYAPLRAGSPVWVGPYRAHYLNEVWILSYVAPIYRHGFVVGVLGMDILFDTMIEQIQSVQVYDSGFAFLMDRNGQVLYHPDMALTDEPVSLGAELSNEILKRRSTGDMLVRYSRNGEAWQLAFAALNDDYKVAVTAPVSEITASQRQLTLLLVLVAVMILAVFTVVTLLLMNALTQPLLRLTSASKRLMAGDYDVELDYEGRDEVGILTQAFRQMRDHLRHYISDLNSRAYTDAMTRVKNKGAFDNWARRLNDAIAMGGSVRPEFAVVMFDCNRLKQINDEHGHDRGDIYLKTACLAICRAYAHSPVFRIGGDEFAVLLEAGDYVNRDRLLKDFDDAVAVHNSVAEKPWERIDVSKGMSVYRPGKDENVEQVLRRADERMYQDKRQRKQGRE